MFKPTVKILLTLVVMFLFVSFPSAQTLKTQGDSKIKEDGKL